MFDMKKKAKTREYTKIVSDVEEPPCRFVCQPPKSELRDGRKRLIVAILFCVFFIICEITGGFIANSLAVLNDALHQIFDLNSLLMSLAAAWISSWKPNDRKTYGYFRAEILGACSVILTLWLLTGVLVYEAILRIATGSVAHGHSDHVNADIMMITAGLTCGACIILAFMLSGMGHNHSHGHNHGEENINVKAAFLHTIGDAIYSFTVLVAGAIIKFKPEWQKADAVCSLIGAVIVVASTFSVVRDSINILFEGIPRSVRIADINRDLSSIDHVQGYHNVHFWAITAGRNALSAHLVVDSLADVNSTLRNASKMLSSKYSLYHCTLQIEQQENKTGIPAESKGDC
ncbi:zinc transporter 8-like [Actinia tenebrosa]|uniref:Zinc transporter 8-like n=1 Tax=Actinia tenebrosa TaxID=6105 RepID=A0A6P8HQT8_ACTTE|nr:zinc transporter 8-like [Actinia tenebrosa]